MTIKNKRKLLASRFINQKYRFLERKQKDALRKNITEKHLFHFILLLSFFNTISPQY